MQTRGYTLVEMVLVIAIFILLGLALMNMSLYYNNFFNVQTASVDVAGSARDIMTDMQSSLLQADAVASSHTYAGTTYTSSSTALVLQLPSIDNSGNIISNTYDYYIYYASSTNAYRIIDANGSSVRISGKKRMSDVLNSMTFTYNGSPITASTKIVVDLITQTTVKQQTIQTHLDQTIYLRN